MADVVNSMNLRSIIGRIAGVVAFIFSGQLSMRGVEGQPRGGRVAWGRLITASSSWSVHYQNDPQLAAFIHDQTSLNIDPTCYPADPAKLDQLCKYPFIFTNNLTNVRDPLQLANLREYLQRGGFLYIDRCVNLAFSLPQEIFYERHVELFRQFLPDAEIRELRDDHEIFNCYFPWTEQSRDALRRFREPGHSTIYGVFLSGRMVALLSLANLQCGWPNSRLRQPASMRMIANIYVYTMTRATTDSGAKRP